MSGFGRLALLLTGGALTLAPAAAGAQTVVTTGVLRDAAGQPSAGTVRLYAWPHHERALSLPLVGETQADPGGAFAVVARDDARLAALAGKRAGWLDFIAVGETPGHTGQWAFTSLITGDAGALRSVAPEEATAGAGAARAAAANAPSIDIAATRPSPMAARAAQPPRCRNEYQTQAPESASKWAIVGELNNAYNDGTRAKFTYAREHSADTNFGVAVSADGGETFAIGGENHVADRGALTFPRVTRRYARKLRSKFEFTREAARTNTCAKWDVVIRATAWLLGTDDSVKQRGALDRCDTGWVGGSKSGAEFHRESDRAVRWTRGAEAFGVYLTTQSGFSRNVTLDYAFGGPPDKPHYLCGPDGKQSAATAGRIYSGSQK